MTTPLQIDGRQGGGQLLRSALTLSLLTGRPFQIGDIRGARPRPGLKRQHLTCVRAALAISGGTAEGAAPGSSDLRFTPGAVTAGDHEFRIDGAGSTSLVLQTVLLPLLQAGGVSRLRLQGGTHNPLAPTFDYLDRVFLPRLRAMGARVELELVRAGFMPAGGGAIECRIEGPTDWRPLDQATAPDAGDRSPPTLRLLVRHAHLKPEIVRRAVAAARASLAEATGHHGHQDAGAALEVIDQPHPDALCGGLALVVEAEPTGTGHRAEPADLRAQTTAFGGRGIRAEQLGQQAARAMRQHLAAGEPVDLQLTDQLLLPLLVGGGQFRAAGATAHTRSNAGLIDAFRPDRLQLIPTEDRRLLVRVDDPLPAGQP